MAITFIPPERPFDEGEFRHRLADEYKMLQDKIDKIGGFRFTIKGWSVTAVIAASAAGASAKSLLSVLTLSAGLAFMLYFFFRFELEQVKLSRLFGDRLRKLEDNFRVLDRNKGRTATAPIWAPFTAHEIVQARYVERLRAQQHSKSSRSITSFWDQWTRSWRIHKQAHVGFYLLLVVLAFVLPLLPRYRDIWMHVRQWRNNTQHSAPATPNPTSGFPGLAPC